VTLDEIIDGLYGLPPSEFTAARNVAARELRSAGQRDAAERVKALRRPTTAAGAVNRLVREQREEVERFLHAAAALRDAQFAGEGDLGAATRLMHETLRRLTGAGGEDVRQSLLAASVDDDAARELLEGRLERELEPRGFGTLLAYAPASPVKLSGAAPRVGPETRARADVAAPDVAVPVGPDDSAARARLAAAQTELQAAEAEEEQARRHWDETRREAEKARAAVDEAQRTLDRLHST
jgi:hypothetical protein